ncbi:conserved Plasmodium protein, unknown function [Plasmodium knowlesi strain H]|uniref:Uncharacterized protein n=3 Tax=Plasmodium knowlesi TaxID=5850 RepID=A0A5K1V7E3_PLAKH|nr:conserved Plasmodium protein, unknown function [Plasmodium knowlesi strain H]OTN68668.1 Uncharacterized protein PKNOH_S01015100 [Plasmodium knowlesi]CAA9986148.1 conserved Plasmodium protein, unknown function [Plasmodium knowlesi strain H]SBO25332.1 conserved Plasmodium protein, unknown function [Plasmodium knowlesi strain H]SBO27643.1 conserved Plasmodium protein, unknown function [Plasmodium knowlesi strain H]VVS75622.1 conserved Plasmodium protein, unknown function [Plasmodium knowlesi s|eukprot:XP_002257560.1 hypothetical protein, conserved in Plasmodium species [Plasmodium knowlesi strain H]
MNISIKESLEHVCRVFNFFGIDYITADLLRRGKYEKNGKRRKKVIICYNFLINDLSLLYCFGFKRRFKPTYSAYVEKEISRVEHEIFSRGKDDSGCTTSGRKIPSGWNGDVGNTPWGEECTYPNDEDETDDEDGNGEDNFVEELGMDNAPYVDNLNIISPMAVLLLEYFEYPRLFHLLKCNFQMCKELLLCIGFLIDCTKLFEHYDKRQTFYESFFRDLRCGMKPRGGRSTSTRQRTNQMQEKTMEKSNEEEEDYFHVINEAMLLLSNRPYDLELFQYRHMYKFLNEQKGRTQIRGDRKIKGHEPLGGEFRRPSEHSENEYLKKRNTMFSAKRESEPFSQKKSICTKVYDDCVDPEGWDSPKGDATSMEEELTLEEYVTYDYATYQENFIDRYGRTSGMLEDLTEGASTGSTSNRSNGSENLRVVADDDVKMYIPELTRNVNKHTSQLIQLQRKIRQRINHMEHLDKNRLLLFHKFNSLVSTYMESHNVVVNIADLDDLSNSIEGRKCPDRVRAMGSKNTKVDLMHNAMFTVQVDFERDRENVKNKLCTQGTGVNKESAFSNRGNNSVGGGGASPCRGGHPVNHSNNVEEEPFDDVNYEHVLTDKITINEFFLLNDPALYNRVCHVYKNGVNLFHVEQLRAVFWLWLQSIFPDDVEGEEEAESDDASAPVDLFDLNNHKFFYDNVVAPPEPENLSIHVLSDLNNFEQNFKLVKEYLLDKGCTIGYNKMTTKAGGKPSDHTTKLSSMIKYVNNLHEEFVAYCNYKKKAKEVSDEMFVDFLETKKKSMTITSSVEKEDYTNLANVVNRHLIGIDKILRYNPILNFSNVIEGIKSQSFIRTEVDISRLDSQDWHDMYVFHRRKRMGPSHPGEDSTSRTDPLPPNHVINFMTKSKYQINTKPKTYASTIFNYSDQFISNNDIYSFSENVSKSGKEFGVFVKGKRDKCKHNFYHILRKVERYMSCVAYNL